MYDVIIENGQVVDGTGNPWFKADVGVKDGKIVTVGSLKEAQAAERINAEGDVVAPGFIDIHTHSDALLFAEPREQAKIVQGITTEVIGNCGISAAPTSPDNLDLLQKYCSSVFGTVPLAWDWREYGDYLESVEKRKTISNVAGLVGHGAIRIAAMGFEDRDPNPEELSRMKRMLDAALDAGAFGLSSGLIYPPGLFSGTSEMIELCKVVANRGGIYTTHMRGETDAVLDSVRETIQVAERSGIPTEISHHKTAGKQNWGKCQQTLRMVEEARDKGLDVTCDAYPYIAASTTLATLLPPWTHAGGMAKMLERLRNPQNRARIKQEIVKGIPGWENYVKASGWDGILISSCKKNKEYEGRTLQAIADEKKCEPADSLFDLLVETSGEILMVIFMMCEEDVASILKHPAVMAGSDSLQAHPRYYGTFPRILSKYVRQDKVLTLAEGVRKMTSMPAQKLGLRERGVLAEGKWADITVFNANTIEDRGTFLKPQQYPVGINYVLVNGRVAVRKGEYTGMVAGQLLRHRC
jgi:N-acyl-D-aspartate/D-glutamate deacylase